MNIIKTPLEGLLVIEPKVLSDSRGFFYETFQLDRYNEAGIPSFVQDNVSRSRQNVLRGLHFQFPHPQGKLISVICGSVFDVVVDIRLSSSTFGQWFSILLNDENHQQLYIPPGFAHGFCVMSETSDFYYQCTDFYMPACEHGIAFNDPQLNIPWPSKCPLLSAKDNNYPLLNEIPHEQLHP
jgi:dTDP-4-dehydrorhamnose 3,5-epimerase